MTLHLPRIEYPEIFIGFVGAIGTHFDPTLKILRQLFEREGYSVTEVKVTDLFKTFEPYIPPDIPLVRSPLYERFRSHISYGNQLRRTFDDGAVLAAATVNRIVRKRPTGFEKNVFLLYQFKRKEEIDLLRSVYGDHFFQVSAYSRRGARIDSLSRRFAASANSAHNENFHEKAEHLVQVDHDEVGVVHGQRIAKIFHDADFILNLDLQQPTLDKQIEKFFELLLSSNSYSPTFFEYGMFAAKAAALKSLDLSRQVGAAIFSTDGDLVAMGANEVPAAGGLSYSHDSRIDAREYKFGYDSNERRKRQVLSELAELLCPYSNEEAIQKNRKIQDSQFMDALEYGRVVHAEMCAICNAARTGHSLKDATLFCTTFPCHMCAKHIVAAGIKKVVFWEPYPKSLAADLHPDSLRVEHSERGEYENYPAVEFEHFYGITPRRYREFFERAKRKDANGNFQEYVRGIKRPFLDVPLSTKRPKPHYFDLEQDVINLALQEVKDTRLLNGEDVSGRIVAPTLQPPISDDIIT
jgi:deoxycytidylate deaminase